jgi:hypothetical protein
MVAPTRTFHCLRQVASWLLITCLAALPAPRSASAAGVVTVNTNFAGMTFADSDNSFPPDTHAATGPNHIVELINHTIAVYSKTTGSKLMQQDITDFFGKDPNTGGVALGPGAFDPSVSYDELAGRFVVIVLQVSVNNVGALLYAVSNTSNPLDGFTEKHRIGMDETPGKNTNGTVEPDFPRLGWNADAHVIAMTMNASGAAEQCDHVSIIMIDKSTVLDANPATFSFHHIDRSITECGADPGIVPTIVPAVMHGASAGAPMWLIEETNKIGDDFTVVKSQVRVTKITNVLSATPTFTPTDINVSSYSTSPDADQPGGAGTIQTNDARFLSASWRGNRLVAAQNIGLPAGAPTRALARWYEFNTSSTPSLTQQGTIDQGTGVSTYFPSIEIASNGDLGMTFMQSSASEFVSMYVTGKTSSDSAGTMRAPALAKAGSATYQSPDCFNGSAFTQDCLSGDFSGISVDPSADNSFCAANEYATSAAEPNWGTWIACFTLENSSGQPPDPTPVGHSFAVTSIKAKKSIKGGGGTLPVSVAVRNMSDHTETLDSSMLGDGVATGLVRLDVEVVDTDGEECEPADVRLDSAKNGKLFSKGPKVLKANGSLTVGFLVSYRCDAPLPNNKLSPDAGDYSHSADVFPDEIDGITDSSASNSLVGLRLNVTP